MQVSSVGRNSVILIRPVNSSLTYLVGLKCMDKKEKKDSSLEHGSKFSKFAL